MQSAPTEVFQTATSAEPTSSLSPSSQHGISATDDLAPDGISASEIVRVSSVATDETDNASVGSASDRRGRRNDTRRISRESSSQESSPGSRIDAYERESFMSRKTSDRMVFQIVPDAAGKKNSISILEFPNEVLTHILSNLPPETLSMMSLVSRRFHKLVTTPHAWRIAFAKYFPGPENTAITSTNRDSEVSVIDSPKSERRFFSRLSALASWRSEYILRTRLLRSLARGRPAVQTASKGSSRQGNAPVAAVVTYGSALLYPVSHLHATFGVGLNKKQPLFIHGASEQGAVTTSDPTITKLGPWGLNDFETFKHFADLFVGEVEYGLGPGTTVGMPNVMDVSQPYGKIYGEACPGGRLFFTSTSEQRGRFLPITSPPNHEIGIPEITMIGCAVTSVWIAKSESVLKATNGVFGCLAGFSNGVLAAYALGVNPVVDRRFAHGEPTARWVISPGVPIVAIVVDERVNTRRRAHRRIWATVLNALGEVYYLCDVPTRPDFKGKASSEIMDRLAWQTGQSVDWHLIEGTRRAAKPDPYNTALVDGSYSPRSSSVAQGLSKEQTIAETKEIEVFIHYKPKHFRDICDGWDMRRRLVIDFEGDDHHSGGESVFVVNCGFDESMPPSIRRFSCRRTKVVTDYSLEPYPPIAPAVPQTSIFGGSLQRGSGLSSPSPRSTPRSRTSSHDAIIDSDYTTQWWTTTFSLGYLRNQQITTIATDESEFAVLTVNEDPLLGMSGGSNTSSPLASPLGASAAPGSAQEIPGRRARLMAVGTSAGSVLLWNMRAGVSPALDVVNTVQPLRYIFTKSPQICSLALTSLYLVHGGNDGLVQAWDPLGSDTDPIRTLNSRFSDRARRRIAQAEASIHGVGNNYYAAGAIVLDPDPTVLRGMVTLGTHLRYWSYSASAADAYKSKKRGQLRHRGERGSNAGTNEQRFHHTGRSVLKDYITNEKQELEREKAAKRKESDRLRGRFGTDLLGEGASEEEMLAYATMLSEEAFVKDEERFQSTDVSLAATPTTSKFTDITDAPDFMDPDMEEAIRLSLLDSEMAAESPQTMQFDIPIKFGKGSKRGTPLRQATSTGNSKSPTKTSEDDDLDFALRLSLAEQESRLLNESEFPTLSMSSSPESTGAGKGKGKSKRR